MNKKIRFIFSLLITMFFVSACTETTVLSMTIIFDSNGGSDVESVTYDGDVLEMPNNPTKEGFVFEGWFWDNETFLQPLTIDSIQSQTLREVFTVYAKWTPIDNDLDIQLQSIFQLVVEANAFTGTYEEWLETVRGPQGLPGEDGREITLRFHEGFIQWKYVTDATWINLVDLNEFISSLDPEVYQITYQFNDEDQTQTTVEVEALSKLVKPTDPVREGYTFKGWYYQNEIWSFIGYVVTEDMTLDAKWELKNYAISYELNGGTLVNENPTSYTVEDTLDLYEPTKNAYVFSGWFLDSDFTIPYTSQELNGDITLYAKWHTDIPPQLLGVVHHQSYYIGSGDYDPLAGITAIAPDGTDITEMIEFEGEYLLDTAGIYDITVSITYDGFSISDFIVFSVSESNIPLALTDTVTIEFWHAMGEDKANLIRGYADEFMDLYPNVTIVIPDGVGNYDTLRSNMINAITAGTHPNMVLGYSDHIAEYLSGHAVLSLNPYINSVTFGLNGDDALDDVIASYLAENSQYDAQGTYYSLPFNKSTEVMVYNQTVFNELGLDVPATWQDIIEIAPQLEAKGRAIAKQRVLDANPSMTESQLVNKIAAAEALVVPAAYDSPGNAFITFARQFGGAYTALNFSTYEGEFLWHENAQTFAAMQFLKDHNDVFTLPEFWDQDYASTPFVNQQTFITIGSSAGVKYNVPSSGFEIGVAPVPYNENMPDENAVIQQGTNIAMLDKGTAQEKLASWLFLKYLISTEVTTHWAINTGYLPVRTSAYESTEYQSFLNNPSTTNAQARAIALAANAAYQQSGHMFFDPAFIGSSRARNQVCLALERIMLGDGNIQSALDEAYNEAKKGA